MGTDTGHILRKILDCTCGAHGERERAARAYNGGLGAPSGVQGPRWSWKQFCLFNIPRIGKIYVVFCILLCLVFHSRFMRAMMWHPCRTFVKSLFTSGLNNRQFAFRVSYGPTCRRTNYKGWFPQKLQPGKHNELRQRGTASNRACRKIIPRKSYEYFCHGWAFSHEFLADRTNGRAHATVSRLSSVFVVCDVMYCG